MIHLFFPSVPQVESEVCPQRILISKLPKMDGENLLNKLEIHFSKKKHGGGEVERCELMPDSWTVVLTFVDKDGECGTRTLNPPEHLTGVNMSSLPSVARGLTDKEDHEVALRNKKHRVKVTPYLNGRIVDLKVSVHWFRATEDHQDRFL